MKFLHTADWHLGKVFHEQSLLEDQIDMLDKLRELLADETYQALLIAGDVYDRSIPPGEAVEAFSAFLGKLKKQRPGLSVLLIPGNHDSASRLGFGRQLFRELDFHFVTRIEDSSEPVILGRDEDTCAFFLLPFASAPVLRETAPPLEAARKRALDEGAKTTVLLAHLFTVGGLGAEAGRVFLGTAEQVPLDLFKGFDYIALGHLHRRQTFGEGRASYAGSPLPYSFEDGLAEQGFLSVELKPGKKPSVTFLPQKPLHGMRSLKGSFNHFMEDAASDRELREAANDYLEFRFSDNSLVQNPLPLLRSRYPHLLAVRQDNALKDLRIRKKESVFEKNKDKRSIFDDFGDFLSEIYGEKDEKKLELFKQIAEEDEDEAP